MTDCTTEILVMMMVLKNYGDVSSENDADCNKREQ